MNTASTNKSALSSSPSARMEQLRKRMHEIAAVLQADHAGLALLGLGSVGIEEDRMDVWSDLDFFAIVAQGHKQRFLNEPHWLNTISPLAYLFKNSPDGYKLLWADGVFGEMAIFEPHELASIPFAPGKVWWAREGFDQGLLQARNTSGYAWTPPNPGFCLGELLTCLYVGLCRYHRGEKLSAWRFIQGYCLDRALELAEFWYEAGSGHRDPYNRDRRVEQRYPQLVPVLEKLLLGYSAIPQAALNLLAWVESELAAGKPGREGARGVYPDLALPANEAGGKGSSSNDSDRAPLTINPGLRAEILRLATLE